MICSIANCDRTIYGRKQVCKAHYARMRNGFSEERMHAPIRKNAPEIQPRIKLSDRERVRAETIKDCVSFIDHLAWSMKSEDLKYAAVMLLERPAADGR